MSQIGKKKIFYLNYNNFKFIIKLKGFEFKNRWKFWKKIVNVKISPSLLKKYKNSFKNTYNIFEWEKKVKEF